VFLQIELGKLGAHGIAALDAYRRQHDAAVAGFDIDRSIPPYRRRR
jgi:hypothetical protein